MAGSGIIFVLRRLVAPNHSLSELSPVCCWAWRLNCRSGRSRESGVKSPVCLKLLAVNLRFSLSEWPVDVCVSCDLTAAGGHGRRVPGSHSDQFFL